MNRGGFTLVAAQEIFSSSATQRAPLGQLAILAGNSGRMFRYVKAGAALVVGNVIQAPAQVTDHDQLTPTANVAIGATAITVTLDATAATADQYAGGFACIDTTPGLGYGYPIVGHPAAALSATLEVQLGLPIQVALTAAASKVTLVPSPYRDVIQSPVTTLTGAVVGVAVYPISSGEYGWIGCGGPHPTLIAGTPGVGLGVVVPATAAGAVVIDGAASATEVVGTMMVTGVDGKVLPVRWNLR